MTCTVPLTEGSLLLVEPARQRCSIVLQCDTICSTLRVDVTPSWATSFCRTSGSNALTVGTHGHQRAVTLTHSRELMTWLASPKTWVTQMLPRFLKGSVARTMSVDRRFHTVSRRRHHVTRTPVLQHHSQHWAFMCPYKHEAQWGHASLDERNLAGSAYQRYQKDL